MDIIIYKGFDSYLLCVADLLRAAKERNILTNIRGSVSGSLVTYLAGITNIDPLEFEIPFEIKKWVNRRPFLGLKINFSMSLKN